MRGLIGERKLRRLMSDVDAFQYRGSVLQPWKPQTCRRRNRPINVGVFLFWVTTITTQATTLVLPWASTWRCNRRRCCRRQRSWVSMGARMKKEEKQSVKGKFAAACGGR
ncbi:hypothetical protein QJS10_CPA16g00423 [Acorus calamus]|uniref:Uncharacterized protein n=1 Tax=Acorus calamus TaxID=4465 RepID=A0AAV9D1K2_ACOCL|nr:hypothetical protein QJS10_CPA16g00423 [Acorus calamus]